MLEFKHPRTLERVTLHTKTPSRIYILHAVLVVCYALSLNWVISTIGMPYELALKELEEIERRLNITEAPVNQTRVDELPSDFWEKRRKAREAREKALLEQDEEVSSEGELEEWSTDEAKIEKELDIEDEKEIEDPEESSDETLKELSESEEEVQEVFSDEPIPEDFWDDEHLDAQNRVPSEYLPNAWAGATLFFLLSAHALFYLLCRWLVWFEAAALYKPATKVTDGSYLQVTPVKHRGKAAMCRVSFVESTERFEFLFQRQRYELFLDVEKDCEPEKTVGDDTAHDPNDPNVLVGEGKGGVRPIACPVDNPIHTYLSSTGLSKEEAQEIRQRFGKNILSVPAPSFFVMMKQQLLSPLVIFQLFTAFLWMLDMYWQYTAFSLLTIIMLESGTVWQRQKIMKSLHSMCLKPYPIFVYRNGEWDRLTTEALLPGDLISLAASCKAESGENVETELSDDEVDPKKGDARAKDVLPCDCLLVRGTAVVNEATLTGESVPLMKDSLHVGSNKTRALDINGQDRIHVLFSGTNMVTISPGKRQDKIASGVASVPKTPDGGAMAYVLRTGFNSSQGSMVQLIEFSTTKVSSNAKEMGLTLLMLLFFALCAAGYVMHQGLKKGDRTTHQLLLKCVIIITAVVPQHLPAQVAFAVNHALMSLHKKGIFCTEPYRVPISGNTTHCLFDKTGTLTTDQLVPVGVMMPDAFNTRLLEPVVDASPHAAMVLAGCHSLVASAMKSKKKDKKEEKKKGLVAEVVGDPIEVAALQGVRWRYDPKTQSATPGNHHQLRRGAALARADAESYRTADYMHTEGPKKGEFKNVAAKNAANSAKERAEKLEKAAKESQLSASKSPIKGLKILTRHHFASKLQRMSVVCKLEHNPSGTRASGAFSGYFCLAKGSPEALRPLMLDEHVPDWYNQTYLRLAGEGMRILALAYKQVETHNVVSWTRERVESNLIFAGLIAFECKTRSDSGMVIAALNNANLVNMMLTGDAPLTALHVARTVGISDKDLPALMLVIHENQAIWREVRHDDIPPKELPLFGADDAGLHKLAGSYVLVVTEKALLKASQQCRSINEEEKKLSNGPAGDATNRLWAEIDAIRVYARMSPQGKARVIRALQKTSDTQVVMCGDGGNDVGALKQANVGIALLSGHGNTNTGDAVEVDDDESAEDVLNLQQKVLKKRAGDANKRIKAEFALKQAEIKKKMQNEWITEELEKLRKKGRTGMMAQFAATKNCGYRMVAELKKEKKRLNKLHGNVFDVDEGKKDPTKMLKDLDLEGAGGMLMVRPGDASIAAPFTSRVPSVRAVVDIIRQGRCTILSALQQQQIMVLECIISAYTLSALSLEGVRSSERQLMASNWLVLTASLAFSYAAPIDKMHHVRPLRSLFHPAMLISTFGQAAIHLFCIVRAVRMASDAMGPATMREVKEFFRKVTAGEEVALAEAEELDYIEQMMSIWNSPFMPNLLNATVFLVETSQIIAVLFVNYKGQPWMKGMLENHPLFLSVFACIAGIGACAWEMFPWINQKIHMDPFPDDAYRYEVMFLVLLSIVGTFIWDRLCTAIFAPKIFKAMMDAARKTSLKDLQPVAFSLGKVVGVVALLYYGNILVWGACWWMWRRWKKEQKAKEDAKIEEEAAKLKKARLTES